MADFHPTAARIANDRPAASHSARYSGASGRCMNSGPRYPRHQDTWRSEATTARPSRTTWMNWAPGSAARMNPARGQPVNLCTNTGLPWAWARVSKNDRNRSTAHGMASAASRSR
jgi:hypothetical protein